MKTSIKILLWTCAACLIAPAARAANPAFGAMTMPPLPPGTLLVMHSPKHQELLSSLGARMVRAALTTVPSPLIIVSWDYPADQMTNVVFELYHNQTPTNGNPPLATYDAIPYGFLLLTTVAAPPVTTPQLKQDFFIVRARDIVSGVYSNWNQ